MDKMIRPEGLGPIAQAGMRYERERDGACGGYAQTTPAVDLPTKQPGLSHLLDQHDSLLAVLSKELCELEDMLEHLRWTPPQQAGAEAAVGTIRPSTSAMGETIQRHNDTVQVLISRLVYLKQTLRGML